MYIFYSGTAINKAPAPATTQYKNPTKIFETGYETSFVVIFDKHKKRIIFFKNKTKTTTNHQSLKNCTSKRAEIYSIFDSARFDLDACCYTIGLDINHKLRN